MGEFGFGSRAAMGTAWLPSDAPAEIQLVAAIASINDYYDSNPPIIKLPLLYQKKSINFNSLVMQTTACTG